MTTGILYINDKDAAITWGVTVDTQSLSALMTPVAQKALVGNETRLEHGNRVITNNPKQSARDVTLTLQMIAANEEAFFAQYNSFCEELAQGRLVIRTKWQPTVYYRLDYLSCNQFTQFMRGIAKFTLKLNEPDPTDRSQTSKH